MTKGRGPRASPPGGGRLGPRSAGILLHITSLPGPLPAGDLGGASPFIQLLSDAGQRWWQMLPLSPVGKGFSPYSSDSAFAAEPMLIDLGHRKGGGGIAPKVAKDRADYRKNLHLRNPLWQRKYQTARSRGVLRSSPFRNFYHQHRDWLTDYALFQVAAQRFQTKNWSRWPAPWRCRNQSALASLKKENREEFDFHRYLQFTFFSQWSQVRQQARRKGVRLLGDVPIFIAHESADCWAHPEMFLLDAKGCPRYVAGCPPDSFHPAGQLWGNVLYDWQALERQGFNWWIRRLQHNLRLYDAVRLDHFIGFYRYWAISRRAKSAKGGRWHQARGEALFRRCRQVFPTMPFIAEDLGKVIPEIRQLRDQFDLPGMKVIHLAFTGDAEAQHHQCHNFPENSVVYTGTHDFDTTAGWFRSLKRKAARDPKARQYLEQARAYLGSLDADAMVRVALQSSAHVAIIPMQDVLGLGSGARMNTPGTAQGNWKWRLATGQPDLQELRALTLATQRN